MKKGEQAITVWCALWICGLCTLWICGRVCIVEMYAAAIVLMHMIDNCPSHDAPLPFTHSSYNHHTLSSHTHSCTYRIASPVRSIHLSMVSNILQKYKCACSASAIRCCLEKQHSQRKSTVCTPVPVSTPGTSCWGGVTCV